VTTAQKKNQVEYFPLVDNRRFHEEVKGPTMTGEISLSHKFRRNNSFIINGWTYGQALGHFLLEKKVVGSASPHIVEVGGGLGDVSHEIIRILLEDGREPFYTILDLSPSLQEAQKARLAEFKGRTEFILGDAEKTDRIVKPADLLIANEVLGDFRAITNIPLERGGHPTGRLTTKERRMLESSHSSQRLWNTAWNMIERYALEVPPEDFCAKGSGFVLNYGAIKFLETLNATLKPAGTAFISENSTQHAIGLILPEHMEYTISSRHVEQVLDRIGLTWSAGTPNDFLQIDPTRKIVDLTYANACAILGHWHASKLASDNPEVRIEVKQTMALARRLLPQEFRPPLFDSALTPEEYVAELDRSRLIRQDKPQVGEVLTTMNPTSAFRYYLIQKPE
jgi:hypothetical protein